MKQFVSEVKVSKGKEGFDLLLDYVFETCLRLVNTKLSQVTIMAAIKAGVVKQDYSRKPGLFTMHDGVSMGDGRMVAHRLMKDELGDIVAKHISADNICPFEAVKEFIQIVDKITFEFV